MITYDDEQLVYINKIKSIIKNYYGDNPTCTVVTFGCQMNAKDSEKLLGILLQCGFIDINDEENADIVIFNTCTVRENANQRLYGRIGQLKKYCDNSNKIIGICGCMMQEKDEVDLIQKKYPFIKLIFGTFNVYKIAELLYNVLINNNKVIEVLDNTNKIVENLPSKRKYSYKCGINIMYGCNNFCSYCIVPYVRGRERSRDKNDIINEINNVVNDGVVEVMLLGQNVNSYGKDIENNITFPELLNEICNIDKLKRIRFMTSHPKDLSDELIYVIKNNNKICRHIHLPVQSGSDRILKLMNRKYTREHYLNLIKKIKNNIDNVSITTDIIVGFPTETEEDFNDTLSLVKEVEFDSAFTFKYSKRTGTKAAEMEGQVPDNTVSERFERLLDVIKNISNKNNNKLVNKLCDCLVEDIDDEKKLLVGRLSNNLLVYFKGNYNLIGSFVNVKITKNNGFYFDGDIIK